MKFFTFFDPLFLGVRGGAKIVGPLDSQWEVSYTCVIHYDISYHLRIIDQNFDARLETKMAAVRPF